MGFTFNSREFQWPLCQTWSLFRTDYIPPDSIVACFSSGLSPDTSALLCELSSAPHNPSDLKGGRHHITLKSLRNKLSKPRRWNHVLICGLSTDTAERGEMLNVEIYLELVYHYITEGFQRVGFMRTVTLLWSWSTQALALELIYSTHCAYTFTHLSLKQL